MAAPKTDFRSGHPSEIPVKLSFYFHGVNHNHERISILKIRDGPYLPGPTIGFALSKNNQKQKA